MRYFAPRFLSLVLLFCAAAASTIRAQDHWTFRSPAPTGNHIASFAFGAGTFVGVGEHGEIITSPDGVTWARIDSPTTTDLYQVVFGGAKFVAIGGTTLLTSADGRTWSAITAPAGLTAINYGNGVYVALVDPATSPGNRRFYTSSDAVTWTLRTNPVDPNQVLFANGIFLAPASDGLAMRSTDGLSWTVTTVTSAAIAPRTSIGVAGNGRFLLTYWASASGPFTLLSTDGLSWRDVTASRDLGAQKVVVPNPGYFGFANGYFYARQTLYGSDALGLYRSPDGETWTPISSNVDINISTFAAGAGVIVAGENTRSASGSVPNPTAYVIHTSTDGINWTARSESLARTYSPGLVYGLGRFFYGGRISHDARTWSAGSEQPTLAAGDRVFQVTSTNLVATVLSSANGFDWKTVDVKILQPAAVAFGNGRYVMVGTGSEISSSEDGDTWVSRTNPTVNRLDDVIYAHGRFIAAGENGTLLTSTDGITWTNQGASALGGFHLKHLAAAPNRLVVDARPITAGATAGTLILDGGINVAISTAIPFCSMTYVNGTFVAASSVIAPGSLVFKRQQLWKSADGTQWTELKLPTATDQDYAPIGPQLVFGNGTLLLSYEVGASYSMIREYNALLQATDVAPTGAPTVTHPPVAASKPRGESVSFSFGVTGAAPFTYQWRHDGAVIPGANSPVFTIASVADADAGEYSVTVTNGAGSVTTTGATLTVTSAIPLVITEQPADSEVAKYSTTVLRVAVTGSGPITYQWRHQGQPIYGAYGATYTVPFMESNPDAFLGDFDVVITAPHSQLTSRTASIKWGGVRAQLVSSAGTVPVGGSIAMTVVASGQHAPFTYQWTDSSGTPIAGATEPTLTLTNVANAGTRSYTAKVRNAAGFVDEARFLLTVVPAAPSQIALATQPTSQSSAAGGTVTFTVKVSGSGTYQFQWRKDGVPIAGANSADLTLSGVSTSSAGSYDVVVSTPDNTGGIISEAAVLQIAEARLVNLSARAMAGTGEDALILGFVVTDSATNNLLLRSVGPGLSSFNLKGALANPKLRIVNSNGAAVADNDDWNESITTTTSEPATSAAMNAVGAFSLTQGSRDSALILRQPSDGSYTALVSGDSNATGIVLNEIYAATENRQRLQNLSARARVGSGDNVLIGGFVINGTRPLNLLIRAVGPSLAGKGIAVPLTNPKLTLYNANGNEIGNNDNWGASPQVAEIRSVTNTIGAFALNEGSNDAAMLVSLAPGVYSAQASSADGSSGVALLEIYVAP